MGRRSALHRRGEAEYRDTLSPPLPSAAIRGGGATRERGAFSHSLGVGEATTIASIATGAVRDCQWLDPLRSRHGVLHRHHTLTHNSPSELGAPRPPGIQTLAPSLSCTKADSFAEDVPLMTCLNTQLAVSGTGVGRKRVKSESKVGPNRVKTGSDPYRTGSKPNEFRSRSDA